MKWLDGYRMRLLLVGVVVAMLIGAGSAKANFTFGTPKNLGRTVSSWSGDYHPCISSDGLELYFASWRKGGYGETDIWVSTRQANEDEWGEPNNLGEHVNSPLGEFHPAISSDGLELYFHVWERAASGSTYTSGEIWVTRRAVKGEPWCEPVRLDLTVPGWDLVSSPSLTTDGLELYFVVNRFADDANEADIYVTRREATDALWGEPVSLGPVVNNWPAQVNVRISSDGLLLVFSDWWASSPRPGGFGDTDMWFSRRATKDDEWSEPVNLGLTINTEFVDRDGMISSDGSTLYFHSKRYSALFSAGIHYLLYQAPILPVVDFDGDGIVAMNDLLMLIESWGTDDPQCDIGPMPWGDGMVDEADLEALMKYWGQDVTGMVAHWKLDEEEGTTAYDSAGANDANLVGDPIWQPGGGWVDGALELDGVDDGAEAGFLFDPKDSPFSAFAWIK
ncbi:hypothetical protein ACFL3Q_10290, partial [Planctomycetota bacterium]